MGVDHDYRAVVSELCREAPLSRKDEIFFAKRKDKGDIAARDKLVLANMRRVPLTAKNFNANGRAKEMLLDGCFGLTVAVNRYDHSRGRVATYADSWIKKYIRLGLGGNVFLRTPHHLTMPRKKIMQFIDEYRLVYGREPTDEGVSKGLIRRFPKLKKELKQENVKMLRAPERSAALMSFSSDLEDRIGEVSSNGSDASYQQVVAVESCLKYLSPRERQIISLHYGLVGEPISLTDIGKKLRITRERARQIEVGAFRRVKEKTDLGTLYTQIVG